jgi:hypothetical protein
MPNPGEIDKPPPRAYTPDEIPRIPGGREKSSLARTIISNDSGAYSCTHLGRILAKKKQNVATR